MEPFRYRRRVGFGECDPARIFFSPRAIEYAVEAAEAWSEEVLGFPWPHLAARLGREVRVLSVDCTYEVPATADQVIALAVEPIAVSAETLTLAGTATLETGDVSFRTTLVLGLAERGGSAPLPLPAPVAARIAALGLSPAAPSPSDAGAAPPAGAERTLTVERRVRYGDCGPSGAMRAPRVIDWALEAVGEWYVAHLGTSWLALCRQDRGTPFLRIRCAYPARLDSGQVVTMAVSVPRLGRSSIGYAVRGVNVAGRPCFEADLTACYATVEGGKWRSTPFPEDLRARILAFQGR